MTGKAENEDELTEEERDDAEPETEPEEQTVISNQLEQLNGAISEIRDALTELSGRIAELERVKHEHTGPEPTEPGLEQPEPEPEPAHFWFREIGKR